MLEQRSFNLNDYGRDLTALAQLGQLHDVIGRDQELAQIVKILTNSRGSNSVLVTGSAGCGKTALMEACLPHRSRTDS